MIQPSGVGPPTRVAVRRLRAVVALLLAAFAATAVSAQEGAEENEAAQQTFQDWRVRCETPENAAQERCYMYQNLVMRESGERVMLVAVIRNPENAAVILTLPLGVALPPGITVQVDDGESTQIPYQRCGRQGCVARLALDTELLTAMRAGLEARVTFHDGAGRPVSLPVSLKGFTAAFDTLGEKLSQ